MAENVLMLVFNSIIDLLKISLPASIVAFAFVFVAVIARKQLAQKYKWSWVKSSFITTYFFLFALTVSLYLAPILDVVFVPSTSGIPPELAPTLSEIILPPIAQFLRLLVVALILAFILMPLEFVGLYLFEKISEKLKAGFSVRLFLTVFLATVFSFAITLFLMPWVLTGIIYLIYFGLW